MAGGGGAPAPAGRAMAGRPTKALATPASGLVVEDASGQHVTIEARPLARLFALVEEQVRCVVLNACYSAMQAEAIGEHVDCVVGMSAAIRDESAIAFAGAFYEALGFGKSIVQALELGKNAIDLHGLSDADLPRFHVREGLAAGRLLLAPAPESRKVAAKKRPKAPAGTNAKVQGSGAVAQRRGAKAAAARGVVVGGDASGAVIITGNANNVIVRGKR